MISIIVAYDDDFGIGKNGDIPWRFPEDMAHFRETTIGNVCIMGRKTWESLPDKFRPLPDRKSIIISKTYKENPDLYVKSIGSIERSFDSVVVESPEEAVDYSKINYPDKNIFIIGGAEIYNYFINHKLADKLIVSRVFGTHQADTYFPKFNFKDRKKISKSAGFHVLEYEL